MYNLFHYILHIDTYLFTLAHAYGLWMYALLFLIIFCETGLVLFPFLPGDSLLFAMGSLCAQQSSFSLFSLFMLLTIASILGNKLNYLIGQQLGPRVFSRGEHHRVWDKLFDRRHLHTAHQFYIKHGGKMLIIARFMPIIRTFARLMVCLANKSKVASLSIV